MNYPIRLNSFLGRVIKPTWMDKADKSGQTGQKWTNWTKTDKVAKCGQTGHVIWKPLFIDSIIVLQLRFEEFVCKIFYVTIIHHHQKS